MKYRRTLTHLTFVAVWVLGLQVAAAQDASPAKAAPQPKAAEQMEAGEPRANTSTLTPSVETVPAPTKSETTPVPDGAPRTPEKAPKAPKTAKSPKAADRIDLDTTTITGNRELPKVMYVVPWKKSDIGDLVGRPMNSLLDEVLAPVDRDVFRREVKYYKAVKGGAAQNTGSGQNGAAGP